LFTGKVDPLTPALSSKGRRGKREELFGTELGDGIKGAKGFCCTGGTPVPPNAHLQGVGRGV
jgi:hypothetical protein